MKKILTSAILMATLILMTASCKKSDVKTFHLTGWPELEISHDGGSTYFGIEANPTDYWTVSTDVDWLEIKHTFGPGDATSGNDDAVLMFFAERWIMNTPRVAKVTVVGPESKEYDKTITQTVKPLPDKPLGLKFEFTGEEQEGQVELPMGYWVKAETNADWVTIVECSEGVLKIKVNENTGAKREATVTVKLSDDAVLTVVPVVQTGTEN